MSSLHRDGSGRFQPGHRLGGRPRGVDVHTVAAQAAKRRGTSLEREVAEVLRTLHELAKKGDVAAAREWLDRVAGRVPLPMRAEIEAGESFDVLLRRALGIATATSENVSEERAPETQGAASAAQQKQVRRRNQKT